MKLPQRRIACVHGFLALLVGTACRSSTPRAEPVPENALAIERLSSGYQSAQSAADCQLFRDAESWRAFWKMHGSWRIPAAAAPEVDFTRSSVVFVALGQRPTLGYGVEVLWIAPQDGRLAGAAELTVMARETKPAKDALVPQTISQPWACVTIPSWAGGAHPTLKWAR